MENSIINKNYILVVISASLFYIASFMLNSVSGRYTISLGADKLTAGLVACVFTLSSFLVRPLRGWYCDCRNRKTVFISGAVRCISAAVILIFTDTVLLLIITRAIFGAGYAALTTAGGTIVCDVVPSSQLQKAISWYGVTNVLSQALAPAAALWLYEYGFGFMAVILAVITVAVAVVGMFINYDRSDFINPRQEFHFFEKTALPAAGTIIFFALSTAAVYSFIPVMAEERNISGTGWFFTVSATGLMISRVLNTKFCSKAGEKNVFYTGAVLFGISFMMMGFSYNLMLLVLAAMFYGLGAGFVHPVVNTRAVKNCSPDDRGLATGTFMMSQDSGMTVGALRWGFVSENIGFTAVYLSAAFTSLLMMYVFHKFLSKLLV